MLSPTSWVCLLQLCTATCSPSNPASQLVHHNFPSQLTVRVISMTYRGYEYDQAEYDAISFVSGGPGGLTGTLAVSVVAAAVSDLQRETSRGSCRKLGWHSMCRHFGLNAAQIVVL